MVVRKLNPEKGEKKTKLQRTIVWTKPFFGH